MKRFVWLWKMVSLSVRYLFYQSGNRWWQDDDPLNGEKFFSLVRLATQYLFPLSWKINFQQSFFFFREIIFVCLIGTNKNFYILSCLLFCFVCLFVFSSVYNRFKVNRNSLLTIRQADNWMIKGFRANYMIRLQGNAKFSGGEWDLYTQPKNVASQIVSLIK